MNKQVLGQARERGSRSGRFLRRTAPLAAVVLSCAALAGPASAAVTGTHAIGALASTSGIELSGYTPGESLRIDALRGGATIGTATGTADALGALDVNGGTAACWTTTTPEILAGDTISVSGDGFTDTMVVQNMTVGRPVQTAPGTVVVRGTASDPTGAPLPLAGVASRVIVTSNDPFQKNGRKDLRAGADDTDGTLTYDAAGSVNWTATFSGLTVHDVSLALNAVETRGIYANATESETTIAQAPGTPGPVAPCTAPLGTAPAPTPPAAAPAASLSTASLSYADQEVGTTSAAQTVTLTNSGSANLVVSATALAGTNPGDYGIGEDTCAGATVAPGASCTVDVSFAPTATGTRSASLSFTDNAAGSAHSVSLSGNGTAAAATTPTTKPKPTPPSKPAPKPKPTPGPKTK